MTPPLPHIVATTRGATLFSDLLPWLLLLLSIVVIGFIVLAVIRRNLTSDLSSRGRGFTLQDLRDLHRSGQLTDEEFEQARAAMIGRLKQPKAGEDGENKPNEPGNGPKSETPDE